MTKKFSATFKVLLVIMTKYVLPTTGETARIKLYNPFISFTSPPIISISFSLVKPDIYGKIISIIYVIHFTTQSGKTKRKVKK